MIQVRVLQPWSYPEVPDRSAVRNVPVGLFEVPVTAELAAALADGAAEVVGDIAAEDRAALAAFAEVRHRTEEERAAAAHLRAEAAALAAAPDADLLATVREAQAVQSQTVPARPARAPRARRS